MRFLSPPEFPVLASPPPSPEEGATYYDETLNTLRTYAEGEWRDHGQQVYVQDTQPTGTPEVYFWLQTGLGSGGDDWTLWFEDGT